jgi:arsenate reductase (thioredoxin)
MKSILFLCTGNSCRSQMAEAWARHLKGEKYRVFSAGTKKHGLNPLAVQVMHEAGVDISQQESKTTEELPTTPMNFVVTVCSDAHDNCPYFPGGKIIHQGFDDPPRLTQGMQDQESILSVYRRVRDEIRGMIENIESIIGDHHES